MSFRWSFVPDQEVGPAPKPYKPLKAKKPSWYAPEHAKVASSMKRDFPRNDKGEAIGTTRELVVDKRPTIMIPPRPTKLGWK